MHRAVSITLVVLVGLSVTAAALVFGAVTPDFASSMYAFGFLAVLLWALKLVFSARVTWKSSPMHWPVAGFVTYATIRYFTSPIEYEARIDLIQICFYALIYFLAASNFHRPRDRAIFLGIVTCVAVGESAYGLWQFATKSDLLLHLSRPSEYRGRGSGTYVCPNHLAGFLEIVLGTLLARIALVTRRGKSIEKTALKKVFDVYVLLFVMVGLLTTFSRAGWVVTFTGLIIFFFAGDWRLRFGWPRMALAALMALTLLFIGFKLLPQQKSIWRTFAKDAQTDQLVFKDLALGDRAYLWKASLGVIRDAPAFGTGPGSWRWFQTKYSDPVVQESVDYAHQDVLQLIAEYGIVGLLLVAAAFGCFYWHATVLLRHSKSSEQHAFALGAVLAVTMILLHSWIDFNMHIPANALLLIALMGFTVAMDDGAERFPRVPLKQWPRFALAVSLLAACGLAAWIVPRTCLAYYLFSRGTDSKVVLHWDNALARYAEAIELDPKFPEPFGKTGDIYMSKARLLRAKQPGERESLVRKAVAFYKESLALNPRQTRTWLRLADAHEFLEQNDQALSAYQIALTLDPNSALALSRLGRFYRNIGEEERAIETFQKAQKLFPDPMPYYNLQDLAPGGRKQ
jgi:O-antigen ligase